MIELRLTLSALGVIRADANPDDVTPGVIGFFVVLLGVLIVMALIWDMTRRVRRVRYREEIRARLAAEAAPSRGEHRRVEGDQEDRDDVAGERDHGQ